MSNFIPKEAQMLKMLIKEDEEISVMRTMMNKNKNKQEEDLIKSSETGCQVVKSI